MLPPEAAAAAGVAADVVPLAPDATGGGLCVNLAGDFLEWSGRLLDGLPKVGDFRIRDVYLKRKEPGRNHSQGVHLAERQGEAPGGPRNGRRISHLVVPRFHQFRGPLGDVLLHFP